jgi:hypothetical protein
MIGDVVGATPIPCRLEVSSKQGIGLKSSHPDVKTQIASDNLGIWRFKHDNRETLFHIFDAAN